MNRRNALRAGATLFGVPWQKILATPANTLPEDALFVRDPEAYWTRIRDEQFFLPHWRSFLNNGSLGVLPRPVYQTMAAYLENAAALELSYPYPRWGYETLDEEREELSKFLGCKKDELALMHNATEANSTVAAGLDLKAGDEVVMTSQEHPSGKAGWEQKRARYGITIREVTIPLPPKDPGQLADLMISAIGPKTRVLFFSGMTSPTGLIMPIREICDAARAKGVITVIDGAHMHGQMALKLSDLNCDFFAGSPHKWMFAPAGSGFLYIREENLDRLWPMNVTGGWDDKSLKAGRFMRQGTNNRAIFEGMIAGLRFAQSIGPDRIYARIHQLARRTYERAARLPYIESLTPNDDRMFAALVGIRFKKDSSAVWQETGKRKIFVSGGQQMRLSSHIHTRPSDIDELFDIIESKMGKV
ncbi:MAG TPA: aminotransferase class V-fold PLP-dependent enzyme [Bryobacteraceae bacterium]|nr:aminotransferase class V-fold PLP-dependent enzyme [Bryobacteraceae bacterium]